MAPIAVTLNAPHHGFTPVNLLLKYPNMKRQSKVTPTEISRAENGKLGRSEGCPAIPRNDAKMVINKVKGGSVLFIYHPSEQYIQQSPVLNDVM